jgi:hypothetical protein
MVASALNMSNDRVDWLVHKKHVAVEVGVSVQTQSGQIIINISIMPQSVLLCRDLAVVPSVTSQC